MSKITTKALTALSVLLALEIILSRFLSITAWNIKIGFSFVPIVIAAMLYGAVPAGIVAAIGDFLGAILFPIGPYFPGFTLTAFLTGLVFGVSLHRSANNRKAILAVFINQFILSLFLNTFWISVLYGSPYLPLLGTRIFQSTLLGGVQFAVIRAMMRLPARFQKQVIA